jgi:hypothetical protein
MDVCLRLFSPVPVTAPTARSNDWPCFTSLIDLPLQFQIHGTEQEHRGNSKSAYQQSLNLPICEKEGDIRQYRTSYGVYIRLPTEPDESETQVRDPVNFIGRVGAKECAEYGPPFADNLTIPKDILENEKILKFEIGYALLSKAWGKGYATEAMKAFVEAYLNSRGFWHPTYQQLYLHGVTGGANHRSARVMEKTGFTLNGIHRWDGPDVFIGGAMQPPEVHVFSLGPSASSYGELESSHNS